MNLKEQLISMSKASKKEYEEEKRKREYPPEEPVIRTDKDWEIISEYLRKLLIKYGNGRNSIYIECESEDIKRPKRRVQRKTLQPGDSRFFEELEAIFEGRPIKEYERIVLSNGKQLEICNEDMQRFCSQYNTKLSYFVYKDDNLYDSVKSTNYGGIIRTEAYFINQKPMLRTDRELNIINEHFVKLLRKRSTEGKITQKTFITKFGFKIKKNCICIDIEDDDVKRIILENEGYEEYLEIYSEDIERFCDQHDLKLEYEYEYKVKPIIAADRYHAYLKAIKYEKVKPIKYCIAI